MLPCMVYSSPVPFNDIQDQAITVVRCFTDCSVYSEWYSLSEFCQTYWALSSPTKKIDISENIPWKVKYFLEPFIPILKEWIKLSNENCHYPVTFEPFLHFFDPDSLFFVILWVIFDFFCDLCPFKPLAMILCIVDEHISITTSTVRPFARY